MAWSTPLTAVSNATLTAAQWNASVKDNLLETAPAKATAAGQYFVATAANAIAARAAIGAGVSNSETTTSTTYGTLATVGPAATSVPHGAQCFVAVGARIQNSLNTAEGYAGFAISGSNTVAATDNSALFYQSLAANSAHRGTASLIVTGLTPGTSTFTMQYRVSTASSTGTFSVRQIAVIPF